MASDESEQIEFFQNIGSTAAAVAHYYQALRKEISDYELVQKLTLDFNILLLKSFFSPAEAEAPDETQTHLPTGNQDA